MRHFCFLLVIATVLAGGEPLLCRGFDASSAVRAVVSVTGELLTMDVGTKTQRLWFALPGNGIAPARQALAQVLGCWWTPEEAGQLTSRARLSSASTTTASVRAFPPLPSTPPGSEALLRRILDPWLGGNGGLALDPTSGIWTATASPAGLARTEQLLSALADPGPRAPHLLPSASSARTLSRSPRGADLGSWCLDLSACSGLAVSLSGDCDPAAAAPVTAATTLGDATAALAKLGLQSAVFHGCLGIGRTPPIDRLHPAIRASVAVLPVGHLCRDGDGVTRLAAQLAGRVEPAAWDMPGWAIAPLAWRRSLLVVADPPTIHAVMTALAAADQIGLKAWLDAGQTSPGLR